MFYYHTKLPTADLVPDIILLILSADYKKAKSIYK